MPRCEICGRATIADDSENRFTSSISNICTRSGCEPERDLHAWVMTRVHREYRPIVTRFKRRARGGSNE